MLSALMEHLPATGQLIQPHKNMEVTAKLNLLPRKVFEIVLEDGAIIKGQFGTWALKRFTDKFGLSLGEAEQKLQSISGAIDYILTAVEYIVRKEKQPYEYNDMNACDWIDALGGHNSEQFLSLLKHTVDENGVDDTEKKTES